MTYIEGTVSGGDQSDQVRFLVDSGVMYSLIPRAIWQKLGLSVDRINPARLNFERPRKSQSRWASEILAQPSRAAKDK